nr:MAG TPA: hypothetical protein [Caudoviricetes sp.]
MFWRLCALTTLSDIRKNYLYLQRCGSASLFFEYFL